MIPRIRGRQAYIILLVTVFTFSLFPPVAQADLNDICQTCYNMVNRIFPPASKEDIEKYRKSWNPFAAGPMLNPAIDIQPQGQTVIQVAKAIGRHRSTVYREVARNSDLTCTTSYLAPRAT